MTPVEVERVRELLTNSNDELLWNSKVNDELVSAGRRPAVAVVVGAEVALGVVLTMVGVSRAVMEAVVVEAAAVVLVVSSLTSAPVISNWDE